MRVNHPYEQSVFFEQSNQNTFHLFQAAEQLISTCGNLHVQISGNAPLAWYKNEADASSKKVRQSQELFSIK